MTQDFYPRPPRGGRRELPAVVYGDCLISIHALREEGDSCSIKAAYIPCDFYPRPPRGGRPAQIGKTDALILFLSTPSARRATDLRRVLLRREQNFYPRPPRGGRRDYVPYDLQRFSFLSTPSARRATLTARGSITPGINFYPRPPRGGRPIFCFNSASAC